MKRLIVSAMLVCALGASAGTCSVDGSDGTCLSERVMRAHTTLATRLIDSQLRSWRLMYKRLNDCECLKLNVAAIIQALEQAREELLWLNEPC